MGIYGVNALWNEILAYLLKNRFFLKPISRKLREFCFALRNKAVAFQSDKKMFITAYKKNTFSWPKIQMFRKKVARKNLIRRNRRKFKKSVNWVLTTTLKINVSCIQIVHFFWWYRVGIRADVSSIRNRNIQSYSRYFFYRFHQNHNVILIEAIELTKLIVLNSSLATN